MFDISLMECIDEKKKLIMEELNTDDEKAKFLGEFISNNSFYGIDNIEKIDLLDTFIADFLLFNPEIPLKEVKDAVYNNLRLFESLDSSSFKSFFSYIIEVGNLVCDDEFELVHLGDKVKVSGKNRSKFTNTVIAKIMTLFNYSMDTDIMALIDLCAKGKDGFIDAGSLVYSIIAFREEVLICRNSFDEFNALLPIHFSQKESKKIVKDELLSNCDMSIYEDQIGKIYDYCKRVVAFEKNRQRELRRELNNIMFLEKWLRSKNDSSTYLEIPSELLKINDEKIKLDILKCIYKHNYKECISASKKYDDLLKNSRNHYKKVLKKYNINVDDNQIDFKMSVDDVKSFLEKMKKFNLINSINIVDVLKVVTMELSEKIFSYLNKGYIDAEFLRNHPDVFDSNLDDVLSSNIDYLNSQGVSSSVIMRMRDNLLKENELIIDGVSTLKEYQLLSSMKKATSYNFIVSDNLDEKLDFLIELGYWKNVCEDLDLLGYSIDCYKRLLVLNRLNIPVNSTEELKAVLDAKRFVVEDEKLDDYLFDAKQYLDIEDDSVLTKDEFLQVLEDKNELPMSTNAYVFDSVIISKNKVKKQLDNISRDVINSREQFDCLTKNKILSEEEIVSISKILNFGKTNQESKNAVKIKENSTKN